MRFLFMFLFAISCSAQVTYHNCREDGETANKRGYQTASEFYMCDEGRFELEGRWSMTIEKGLVYRSNLGRIDGEPFRATPEYLRIFKWCPTPKPWDKTQMELCGLIPPKVCWDEQPPKFNANGDWSCIN